MITIDPYQHDSAAEKWRIDLTEEIGSSEEELKANPSSVKKKYVAVSVIVHLTVIVGLATYMIPRHSPISQIQPLNSYLVIKPSRRAQITPIPVEPVEFAILANEAEPEVTKTTTEPSAEKEPSADKEPSASKEPSADKEPSASKEPSAISPKKTASTDTIPDVLPQPDISHIQKLPTVSEQKLRPSILDGTNKATLFSTSKHLQTLNNNAIEEMAREAASDFRAPKALVDKSRELSTNQQMKLDSTSFAEGDTGIVVISTFGDNETTIMHGGNCFTVPSTKLDDPMQRGPSVWMASSGCSGYDKFDGQLQKSLDKHLKKPLKKHEQ